MAADDLTKLLDLDFPSTVELTGALASRAEDKPIALVPISALPQAARL